MSQLKSDENDEFSGEEVVSIKYEDDENEVSHSFLVALLDYHNSLNSKDFQDTNVELTSKHSMVHENDLESGVKRIKEEAEDTNTTEVCAQIVNLSNQEEALLTDSELSPKGVLLGDDYYASTYEFDPELFDFDLSSWKRATPIKVINEILRNEANGTGGVQKTFHQYFGGFAHEVFMRIKDIYPYLIPAGILLQLCAHLFSPLEHKPLNAYFKEYKRKFPTCPLAKDTKTQSAPMNCTELLVRKIDSLLIRRAKELKDVGLWPYKNHKERAAAKPYVFREAPKSSIVGEFDYLGWRKPLERRMDAKSVTNSNSTGTLG